MLLLLNEVPSTHAENQIPIQTKTEKASSNRPVKANISVKFCIYTKQAENIVQFQEFITLFSWLNY